MRDGGNACKLVEVGVRAVVVVVVVEALAEVDGEDAFGTALKEAIRKPTRTRAEIDRGHSGWIEREFVERVFELQPAAAHELVLLRQLNRVLLRHRITGLGGGMSVHADGPGHDAALGALAALAQAPRHQRLIQPDSSRHVRQARQTRQREAIKLRLGHGEQSIKFRKQRRCRAATKQAGSLSHLQRDPSVVLFNDIKPSARLSHTRFLLSPGSNFPNRNTIPLFTADSIRMNFFLGRTLDLFRHGYYMQCRQLSERTTNCVFTVQASVSVIGKE